MKTKPILADLTDMVFEGRFRAYGAYHLRKLYNQRLAFATVLGLGLFFAGIVSPNMIKEEKAATRSSSTILTDTVIVTLLDKKKPEKEKIIIPEIKPPKPPIGITKKAFKIPEPKPKDELKGQDSTIASMKNLAKAPSLGHDDFMGDDDGFINIPDETGDGKVFTVIEEEKEPGIGELIIPGEEPEALNLDDIRDLIGYPELARENGIEGMVVVRILIDKEGNYRKHKIIKKIHPLLAEAVEKQIPKLKFTPAIQGNQPILFWVNIPFRFTVFN